MASSSYSVTLLLHHPDTHHDHDFDHHHSLSMQQQPLSLKRSRPQYQSQSQSRAVNNSKDNLAMGSSEPEIIDLTADSSSSSSFPAPPPSKRRKSSSISIPISPSISPDLLPAIPHSFEDVEYNDIETVPTESTWSRSSYSSSSNSSMSTTSTTSSPQHRYLLPPWGPNPIGRDWLTLGPLSDFPQDPLALFYEAPTLYPVQEGPSYNIITADPEIAFIFHVKSVGAKNLFAKSVRSTDSMHILPSSLTTTFFISTKMDSANLNILQRDMTLARKIGFLPFRSQAIAVNAIRNYSRLNRLCRNPEQLDGAAKDAQGEYEETEIGEEEKKRVDIVGNPLYLEIDWYPGNTHYNQIAADYKETSPWVRAVKGVPGFASPEEWKPRHHRSLRKFNWDKWEDAVLRQKRGRIVG